MVMNFMAIYFLLIFSDLFHFAWSYREWNLVFYLIEKYHYTYQLPYEYDPLTVDNVCFAYEDGLIAKDKVSSLGLE